ncbi:hypothetical protein ATKI12_6711 [Kitasatospora sp. Ki12]
MTPGAGLRASPRGVAGWWRTPEGPCRYGDRSRERVFHTLWCRWKRTGRDSPYRGVLGVRTALAGSW